MKKLIFLTLIILSISLIYAGYSYSGIDDRRERMTNDQAGIFSPGYINVTKQKTDAIIRNSSRAMSSPEQKTDALTDNLGRAVKEDSLNKVTPELKKKSGALGENAQNSNTTKTSANSSLIVGAAQAVDPDDIPAYVRGNIQEYLNLLSYGYDDATIKRAGEKYYALWGDSNYVEAQIFDSNGSPLLAAPKTLISNAAFSVSIYYDNVTTFENGNLAVFWEEGTSGTSSLKAQVFNPNGDAVLDTPVVFTGSGLSSVSMSGVTALENGHLAVVWKERLASNYCLKAQILDSVGNTILSTPLAIANSNVTLPSVTTLQNGKVAVVWTELPGVRSFFQKVQVFDSEGTILFDTPVIITGGVNLPSPTTITNVTSLENGNLAVFWRDGTTSIKAQMLDSAGNVLYNTAIMGTGGFNPVPSNIAELEGGKLAVFWKEVAIDRSCSLNAQILGSDGTSLLPTPINFSTSGTTLGTGILDVSLLEGGKFVVLWRDGTNLLRAQIFNSNGGALTAPIALSGSGVTRVYIGDVTILENGNIAVFWVEEASRFSLKVQVLDSMTGAPLIATPTTLQGDSWSISSVYVDILDTGSLAVFWRASDGYNSQIVDQDGNIDPITTLRPPGQTIITSDLTANSTLNPYTITNPRFLERNIISQSFLAMAKSNTGAVSESVAGIFKAFLAHKGMLSQGVNAHIDSAMFAKMVRDSLNGAVSVPAGEIDSQNMVIALALANILKNPTDEQKLILDAVQALIFEAEQAMDQSASPELKKASDDLLQVVAAVLVAQAIPDLLKEGDIASIKNIFSDMNQEKKIILLEYQNLIAPYYNEIRKLLANNIALLQANNIISKEVMEKELSNLEPREVDRILEKIRNMKNKSADIQAVLDQEAKSRKEFIDPNQKMLEDKMKLMMQAFTQRIAKALEDSGATKKK